MFTSEEIARYYTILRVVVGSKLYGTDNAESDVDEMGVFVEPIEYVAGFSEIEQHIAQKRDAAGVMITESKIYSLRKFLRLALDGNPDVTPVLFVPESLHTVSRPLGTQMQALYPHIVSRKSGVKFLGYMESQRQRMLGERGQKKVNRPELLAKYGFDTKYAMQLLRLGINGVELLTTGRLQFPMTSKDRTSLKDVRGGRVSLNDILQQAGDLARQLKDAIDVSPLPAEGNRALVEDWMVTTYYRQWRDDLFRMEIDDRVAGIQ